MQKCPKKIHLFLTIGWAKKVFVDFPLDWKSSQAFGILFHGKIYWLIKKTIIQFIQLHKN